MHAITLSVVDRVVVVVKLTVTVIVTMVLLMELTMNDSELTWTKTVTVLSEWTIPRTQGMQCMLSCCQW